MGTCHKMLGWAAAATVLCLSHSVQGRSPYQVVPAFNTYEKRRDDLPDYPGPQNDMLDGFTKGARRPFLAEGAFGRDVNYNCSNGEEDWGTLGFKVCEGGTSQSPIDIVADIIADDVGHSAANVIHFDAQEQVFTLSHEYGLNLTAVPGGGVAANTSR